MNMQIKKIAFALLLACEGFSVTEGYREANTTADSVPKPSDIEQKYPQLSQMDKYSNLLTPDLVAYADDPNTTCTIFAADNDAINRTMTVLGQYVGLFMQNFTMIRQVLNYHIIPGKHIKAADMGTNVTASLTRANETLWFIKRNDLPYVSFGEKYVIPIQIADIPAGGCVVHAVNSLLVPPSLIPLFEDWQQKAGNPLELASPQSDWRQPLPPAQGDAYTPSNSTPASLSTNNTQGASGSGATSGTGSSQVSSGSSGSDLMHGCHVVSHLLRVSALLLVTLLVA